MIVFSDRPYVKNHEKKPSGQGYWAFQFDGTLEDALCCGGNNIVHWYPKDKHASRGMLFSEAKKQAMKDAEKQGVKMVYVLS